MMGVGAKRALGLYRSCAPRQHFFTFSRRNGANPDPKSLAYCLGTGPDTATGLPGLQGDRIPHIFLVLLMVSVIPWLS